MEDVLKLVETYGITLVLLLGSCYALYKFFVFSIYEVRSQFSKYHENNAKDMQEVIAWAKRTFDKYPSAYANLAASKYCKDPNYAKKSKGKKS